MISQQSADLMFAQCNFHKDSSRLVPQERFGTLELSGHIDRLCESSTNPSVIDRLYIENYRLKISVHHDKHQILLGENYRFEQVKSNGLVVSISNAFLNDHVSVVSSIIRADYKEYMITAQMSESGKIILSFSPQMYELYKEVIKEF